MMPRPGLSEKLGTPKQPPKFVISIDPHPFFGRNPMNPMLSYQGQSCREWNTFILVIKSFGVTLQELQSVLIRQQFYHSPMKVWDFPTIEVDFFSYFSVPIHEFSEWSPNYCPCAIWFNSCYSSHFFLKYLWVPKKGRHVVTPHPDPNRSLAVSQHRKHCGHSRHTPAMASLRNSWN